MQPFSLNSHEVNSYYCCYLRDQNSIKDLSINNYDTFENPGIGIDEESFLNSSKQAEALLLRANFKANIDTDKIGNYGIIVNIAFRDTTDPQVDKDGNLTYPPKLIAYILDMSKMTGNPMKFYDYSSQYVVLPFAGEDYLYIDSVLAFSEGFVDEREDPHDGEDDVNIYVDGLEIIPLSEVSAVAGDYKLRLTTPSGNTVKVGDKNSLNITAKMS
jgi:hypothetical protein